MPGQVWPQMDGNARGSSGGGWVGYFVSKFRLPCLGVRFWGACGNWDWLWILCGNATCLKVVSSFDDWQDRRGGRGGFWVSSPLYCSSD